MSSRPEARRHPPCHLDRSCAGKLRRVDGRFPTARFAVLTAPSLEPRLCFARRMYNATGDLSTLDEPTAKLLQYILTDNASTSDGLVRNLEQAVRLACESEELADRYDYGVRVGREEEASRMSALFAAMVDAGVSSDDIVTALESVDKESLYEQYGIGD